MKSLLIVVLAVIISVFIADASHWNSFDQIRGCMQYNGGVGYHGATRYFPTANMLHVGHTSYSKYFKIAILGPSDGHFRFGKTIFPYDTDVIEIVLGGWGNQRSAGRRQHRTSANRVTNTVLAVAQTPNLLSPFHPIMFVLEVFNDGRVEVRFDGQPLPFLSFRDNNRIPVNYLGFSNYERDLIFFYDCPLSEAKE